MLDAYMYIKGKIIQNISVLLIVGYNDLFNKSSLIIIFKNHNSNSIANQVLHLNLLFIRTWI